MKTDQIYQILSAGKATTISLDPDLKTEINRVQLDSMVREARKHLTLKKRVHLIMIRE